jgi:predicted deacylase
LFFLETLFHTFPLRYIKISLLSIINWASSLLVVAGTVGWQDTLFSGSDEGYLTYDEANGILDTFLSQYPSFLSSASIGTSFNGRDIRKFTISTPSAVLSSPVLLTSAFHGNEPVTVSVSLYIMGSLLESLQSGDESLFSSRALHIVPFVNPDGYVDRVRKNRRPSCETGPLGGGVDLNRNFATGWKHIGDPCSLEYAGTEAFSEPETQALRDLTNSINFLSVLNLHSYGEILTIPYNYGEDGSSSVPTVLPSHSAFYQSLQSVFGFSKFGPSTKTLNYTASGESDDWFYRERGIVSMSAELGEESDGFRPTMERVRTIARKNFERVRMWIYMAGGAALNQVRVDVRDNGELGVVLINSGLVEYVGGDVRMSVSGAYCPDWFVDIAYFAVAPLGGENEVTVPASACKVDKVCISSSNSCRCFTEATATGFQVPRNALIENMHAGCQVSLNNPPVNWFPRLVFLFSIGLVALILVRIVVSTIQPERVYDVGDLKDLELDAIPLGVKVTYE